MEPFTGRSARFAALVAALALLSASPAVAAAMSAATDKPGVGDPAPLFQAKDIEGSDASLDNILKSGKAVVLNFWGLRCSSCIEEIGYLNPIYEKYRQRGAVFLGVNVDGAAVDAIRTLMPKMANVPRFPVLADPAFEIPDLYNMTAAPLSFVIGKDGKILYRHEDFRPGDEKALEDALRQAISPGN